ncbi:protein-tyrosine kinase HTK98 [Capsaspora owczarzaki ATCC 30864]|uniref:TKL protein kinase n=1 Tax=Capsaspora owczarzaki (strain ATCC 30864) TaxID=595528 RepID=A0A0D2WIP2_CAPO3|nr:protein-tyrosine kinase HTK98 [Capsaspora owczarzaki ATCC 30864]KJE89740.1 TKL protein kinase [Capsaspora owczarzaki ATCC 30864]|eukprot:XP_004366041.1 protein-tyrosine kinase HTK98 [Capsaspora owczarzaki ATCC 30864]
MSALSRSRKLANLLCIVMMCMIAGSPANAYTDACTKCFCSANMVRNCSNLGLLPDNAFANFHTATYVDLSDAQLTGISAQAFVDLNSLSSLVLRNTQLASAPTAAFSSISSSLHSLAITLPMLTSNAFVALSNLETLDLDGSTFTTIPSNAFAGLSDLELLSLYNTSQLTELPSNAFADLSNLQLLDLSLSGMTRIASNAFAGLSDLESLELIKSGVTMLSANTFSGLSSLTYLTLSQSPIAAIDPNAFAGLTSLQTLLMPQILVTSIARGTFSGLPALQSLGLPRGQLSNIQTGAFEDLGNIQQIDLSSNALSVLPPGLFQGLSHLNTVNLSNNSFVGAPASTVSTVTSLLPCHYLCATCWSTAQTACCAPGCLNCTSSECTECYGGYTLVGGSCISPDQSSSSALSVQSITSAKSAQSAKSVAAVSITSISSVQSVASVSLSSVQAVAASQASASVASVTSLKSVVSASASVASILSITSAISASVATVSVASRASASAASASSASYVRATEASAASASLASFASANAASASSASYVWATSASVVAAAGQNTKDDASAVPVIAGAVLGGIAVLLACVVVLLVLRRRRKAQSGLAHIQSDVPLVAFQANPLANGSSPIYDTAQSPTYEAVQKPGSAYQQPGSAASHYQQPTHYQEPTTPASEYYATPLHRIYDKAVPMAKILRQQLQLGEKLGSGAFGVVLRGRLPVNLVAPNFVRDSMQTHVDVAVKTIQPDANEKSQREFADEARMVAKFNHPNIVASVAALLEEQPPMFVLELMPYGDLQKLLQKSHVRNLLWTEAEQAHALAQVAAGMTYLQSIQFVHRDIAARNCLVGHELAVKISDFGLSRVLAEEKDYYKMQTKGRVPVKWMAPECLNYRKFTHQSDVWAFGVLAWEVFSYGSSPYSEVERHELLTRIEAGLRLAQPEHCSSDVYQHVQRCWNLDPAARPSFAELNTVFSQLSAGSTIRDIGTLL